MCAVHWLSTLVEKLIKQALCRFISSGLCFILDIFVFNKNHNDASTPPTPLLSINPDRAAVGKLEVHKIIVMQIYKDVN